MTKIPAKERRDELITATGKLIAGGRPLSSIRVAEIAQAAGMGKGTVYEYFHTKEELLTAAVRHSFEGELTEVWARVEAAQGFHGRFTALLEAVGDYSQRSVCLLRLAAGDQPQQEVLELFVQDFAPEFDRLTRTLLDTMTGWARDEALITSEDDDYCRLVLFGTMSTYLAYCGNPLRQDDGNRVREYLYTALIKALN